MDTLKLPFTNLQVELLRMYSHQVDEKDLLQIKELIGRYFANRLTRLADDAWERNGWSDEYMEALLNDVEQ